MCPVPEQPEVNSYLKAALWYGDKRIKLVSLRELTDEVIAKKSTRASTLMEDLDRPGFVEVAVGSLQYKLQSNLTLKRDGWGMSVG